MQVHIKTYGCTLNQADSDMMEGILKDSGVSLGEDKDSDVVIVNTCTVKNPTEQKILYLLGELERNHKRTIVTGCMASANRDLIERHAPSASIVTATNMGRIAEAVEETALGNRVVFDKYNRNDRLVFFNSNESIISKVPVSEGCLSNCSFCETKFARGPLNSFSEDMIVNAVAFSAKRGAKEIQLTSQDMGAYGLDKKTSIARLMQRVSALEGDFKVRVGMMNPEHLDKYIDEFIDALKSDRFYKFVHLPVQSGSNKVLGEMKRMYTIEQFNDQIAAIRKAIPDVTIETDIIVGFPTETQNDFEETLDFVRETKPNVVNMCRFSARPHAAATRMRQLHNNTIAERSAELARVVRKIQKDINDTFVGRPFEVLVTEDDKKSMNARTDSYKKVILKKGLPNVFIGSKIKVVIERASCNVLYGSNIAVAKPVVV